MTTAEPIKYFSTNQAIFGAPDLEERISSGSLHTVGLGEAIIRGQADDGGLLMPSRLPQMSLVSIAGMRNARFEDVSADVITPYFEGVLKPETIRRITHEAYGRKGHSFKPFLERISRNKVLARLDEGPTNDFKNYAAEFLFRVTNALRAERPEIEIRPGLKLGDMGLILYLTSTTGDTGGAMGTAARNMPGIGMVIFYPSKVGSDVSY